LIKPIKILKKLTGSVRFRFFKPGTGKTEPNQKNQKKTEPNWKNRAKTESNRKNRAKPEKTEPNRAKTESNRAKTGLNRFFL
jgi:hypothetical protein